MTPTEYMLDLYNMDADEFEAKYKGQHPYSSIVHTHASNFSPCSAFHFIKQIIRAASPELATSVDELCYVELGSGPLHTGGMIRIYGDADLLTVMRLRYGF